MNKAVRIVISILAIITLFGGIMAAVLTYRTKLQNQYKEAAEYANTQPESEIEDTADTTDTQPEPETVESVGGLDGSSVAENAASEMELQPETETAESISEAPVSDSGDASQTAPDMLSDETTIILTGDVMFDQVFRLCYNAAGIGGVIEEGLRQQLRDADILMINHEFPFSDRGVPMEDKRFTFRCSPSYVTALTEMGVDIASLANNHALDFGKEALTDTFATLDGAGIRYAGAGDTVERAEQLQVIETNGRRFGFLAVTRVVPDVSWKIEFESPGLFSCYDETRLVELVGQAKTECDFLVVYPHWGIEREEIPEEYQTVIARKCIEAGADAIVGAHSHCLQSIEYIQGKPVFYSLGNFIFNYAIAQTAYLKITVDSYGTPTYRIVPAYADGGITMLAGEEARTETIRHLNEISATASLSEEGIVTEK